MEFIEQSVEKTIRKQAVKKLSMSIPQNPDPALAIMSIISSRWSDFWPGLFDELQPCFGPVEEVTEPFDFRETSYYDQELGTPLQRRMVSFRNLVDPSGLAGLKVFTNQLEHDHAFADGRRLFNLDPGLLSLERLVLGTGKNYTHRIYLSQGIWADLTLVFQHKRWQVLPWTFPDYAGERMQALLSGFRETYRRKLQEWKAGC